MRILVVEPGKAPEIREIDGTLRTMQDIVGGTIQPIYPFDDLVALVCHDEGKLLHLSANRALRDKCGEVYDIICGTFFLCGAPPDSDHFDSLSEEQLEKFQNLFQHPEIFLNINGRIAVFPCDK